jgi:hypothetical protein
MSGFVRKIPSSVRELQEILAKLHANRAHIKSVKVSPVNGRLEIDLDGRANFFGYPDMFMPLKKGSGGAVQALVERLLNESSKGLQPSDADAQMLFDMIDHEAR